MTTFHHHTVVQGEDVVSIAQHYRVRPEDIWDHAKNKELRQKRKDANVLYPGDVLVVPLPDEQKKADIATGKRHTFHRKGRLQKIIVVFKQDDEPRAGLPYVLTVGDLRFEGTTGGDGKIEHEVPSTARRGVLLLGTDESADAYELRLGHLDPVDTPTGLRARLYNLGFLPALEADDPAIERAIEAFQEHAKLKVTGRANAATRAKLVEVHGS